MSQPTYKKALEAIADGEGDPQVIARQTLEHRRSSPSGARRLRKALRSADDGYDPVYPDFYILQASADLIEDEDPVLATELRTFRQKLIDVLDDLTSGVDPDGAIAKAICELKSAADYVHETGSTFGAGRLHRITDAAADAAGLKISESMLNE